MAATWTLALFVICATWSAGLLVCEAVSSLTGRGRSPRVPALVLAAALPLFGLLVMAFSLQHPERLFNVLANPGSPISQQVYAVLFAIVACAAWLVAHSRTDDGATPRWCAAVVGIAGLLLVIATARRHMLPSDPLCDSPLWMLFTLGLALVLGITTESMLAEASRDDSPGITRLAGLLAAAVNAAGMLAYGLWARGVGLVSSVGRLQFDPTHPTAAQGVAKSLLTSGEAGCILACAILGALVPLVCGITAHRWGSHGEAAEGNRAIRLACGTVALVVELTCAGGILFAVL